MSGEFDSRKDSLSTKFERRPRIFVKLSFRDTHENIKHMKIKKKTLWPLFLWMGFNYLKVTATSRRKFTFYHSVPRNSWYSFFRPRKDERLSRPWSHPVVSSTRPLDWHSSPLTTRPLLHNQELVRVLQLRVNSFLI